MRLDGDTNPNAMNNELWVDIMRIIRRKSGKGKQEYQMNSRYKSKALFTNSGA